MFLLRQSLSALVPSVASQAHLKIMLLVSLIMFFFSAACGMCVAIHHPSMPYGANQVIAFIPDMFVTSVQFLGTCSSLSVLRSRSEEIEVAGQHRLSRLVAIAFSACWELIPK